MEKAEHDQATELKNLIQDTSWKMWLLNESFSDENGLHKLPCIFQKKKIK